jgi:coproporphyrinogen III oxidase-like Fe-S oxidoreductase
VEDGRREAVALDADSVTIYQMEVPYNTGIAKEARDHGGVSEVASWDQKRAWVDYAFKQFEAAGYVASSGYTLVKPERHAGFVYRDSLWRGADLVATGVASFGHFQGVHYQNLDKWETYIPSIEAGELPINRALPVERPPAADPRDGPAAEDRQARRRVLPPEVRPEISRCSPTGSSRWSRRAGRRSTATRCG